MSGSGRAAVTILTPDEVKLHDLAERVFAQVRRLTGGISEQFIQLGTYLRLVQEYELWQVKGYASFEDCLSDPEVNGGLHRRHLFRALRTAKAYVPLDGSEPPIPLAEVARLGITKAAIIAPVITAPTTTPAARRDLVATAQVQTVPMLTRALRRHPAADDSPELREAAQRERLATRLHGLVDALLGADDPTPVLEQLMALCQTELQRLHDISRRDNTGWTGVSPQ